MVRNVCFAAVAALAMVLGAMVPVAPSLSATNDPIEIEWGQLIPGLQTFIAMGLVTHGQNPMDIDPDAIAAAGTVKEFDGMRVAIAGFVVPLDLDGTEVTDFLLVPYIGACIHVPPPPPNQVIYIHSKKAVKITGLFDAMVITGVISTMEMTTDLADVGYRLEAEKVVPFEFLWR